MNDPDIRKKYVAIVRDGITPRAIERCETDEDYRLLCDLHGWHRRDVTWFARAIGLQIPEPVYD